MHNLREDHIHPVGHLHSVYPKLFVIGVWILAKKNNFLMSFWSIIFFCLIVQTSFSIINMAFRPIKSYRVSNIIKLRNHKIRITFFLGKLFVQVFCSALIYYLEHTVPTICHLSTFMVQEGLEKFQFCFLILFYCPKKYFWQVKSTTKHLLFAPFFCLNFLKTIDLYLLYR
jgi:hypothetical protein